MELHNTRRISWLVSQELWSMEVVIDAVEELGNKIENIAMMTEAKNIRPSWQGFF
jgi:hypothetical protein